LESETYQEIGRVILALQRFREERKKKNGTIMKVSKKRKKKERSKSNIYATELYQMEMRMADFAEKLGLGRGGAALERSRYQVTCTEGLAPNDRTRQEATAETLNHLVVKLFLSARRCTKKYKEAAGLLLSDFLVTAFEDSLESVPTESEMMRWACADVGACRVDVEDDVCTHLTDISGDFEHADGPDVLRAAGFLLQLGRSRCPSCLRGAGNILRQLAKRVEQVVEHKELPSNPMREQPAEGIAGRRRIDEDSKKLFAQQLYAKHRTQIRGTAEETLGTSDATPRGWESQYLCAYQAACFRTYAPPEEVHGACGLAHDAGRHSKIDYCQASFKSARKNVSCVLAVQEP
jgi:hypothetical protein